MNPIDIIRANDHIVDARMRDDGLIEAVLIDEGVEELLFYLDEFDDHGAPVQILADHSPEMYRWDKKTDTWFHSHKTLMQHKLVK